jgi:hypothetical protein
MDDLGFSVNAFVHELLYKSRVNLPRIAILSLSVPQFLKLLDKHERKSQKINA